MIVSDTYFVKKIEDIVIKMTKLINILDGTDIIEVRKKMSRMLS